MAKMNEKIMAMINKQPVIALATSGRDGKPNVVPMSAKKIVDPETILLSDQFFNKTLRNVRENPYASIAVWDGMEGYQIKGAVTIETKGKMFDETYAWIDERGKKLGFPLKCKGIFILKIEEIFCVSPGPEAGKKIA